MHWPRHNKKITSVYIIFIYLLMNRRHHYRISTNWRWQWWWKHEFVIIWKKHQYHRWDPPFLPLIWIDVPLGSTTTLVLGLCALLYLVTGAGVVVPTAYVGEVRLGLVTVGDWATEGGGGGLKSDPWAVKFSLFPVSDGRGNKEFFSD